MPDRNTTDENRSERPFASPPCSMHELQSDYLPYGATPSTSLGSWPEVREWRKATRAKLIAERRALSRRDKNRCTAAITDVLREQGPALSGQRVGFYWPLKGEIDLVPFMRAALRDIIEAALPVIIEKQRPLEFWHWAAQTPLSNRGLWNIPSPAERVLVEPRILLIPLVGFDEAGYRLGYGGGYYDRTLAALPSKPLCVGIGHELGRLSTIQPQPHDVPMDAIVTERGIAHFPTEQRDRPARV